MNSVTPQAAAELQLLINKLDERDWLVTLLCLLFGQKKHCCL
jgi:hypothetical protein